MSLPIKLIIFFEFEVFFEDEIERKRMMLIIFEQVHFEDDTERNRMMGIIFEQVHFEEGIKSF